MSIPSNGITPEVIRGVMPPYRLSPDLVAATLAALPAPPSNSTTAWRQDRVTRVVQEFAGLKPADAAQARIAAQLITTRELAHTFTLRAQAPNLEFNQICRLGSIAVALLRSAAALDRTLARHQQMPTPFFGVVMLDEVDIPALATIWASEPLAPASAGSPAAITPPPATPPPAPNRPGPQALVPEVAPTDPSPDSPPDPQPDPTPTPSPPLQAQPVQPSGPATQPAQPPATPRTRPAGANWVIEQLDQGPGYSREVLRPRTAADPVPEPAS